MTRQNAEHGPHTAESDAGLTTIYVLVGEANDGPVAHVMMPPDVDDLRWTCSQRKRPGMPQCLWTASEAFATDEGRRESFLRHHETRVTPSAPTHADEGGAK